jgi:hypothetical protein
LSGKISLSETLERPRIVGEVQLVNGKLASSDSFLNVIGASTLAIFDGNHASLEFLNLATKDVDLRFAEKLISKIRNTSWLESPERHHFRSNVASR